MLIRVLGLRRLLLADDPAHFVEGCRAHPLLIKTACCPAAVRKARHPVNRCRSACRCRAGHFRLLGAHVIGRTDHLAKLGEHRLLGELLAGRLGHAEVDHLGHGPAVVACDQHVRRFEIAVNDAFLVRVLHRLADLDEQFEPLVDRQVVAGRNIR